MEKDYMKAVRPEWEHGDKYASRRYEGESIALRWCCEDLEAALENGKVSDGCRKRAHDDTKTI